MTNFIHGKKQPTVAVVSTIQNNYRYELLDSADSNKMHMQALVLPKTGLTIFHFLYIFHLTTHLYTTQNEN